MEELCNYFGINSQNYPLSPNPFETDNARELHENIQPNTCEVEEEDEVDGSSANGKRKMMENISNRSKKLKTTIEEFTELPPLENNFILEYRDSKNKMVMNRVQERTVRCRLRNPELEIPIEEFMLMIIGLFESLIEQLIDEFGVNTVVRICIDHPSKEKLQRPIIILPRILGLLNPWDIFDKIESVLSSGAEIPLDDLLRIYVGIIKLPNGNGRSRYEKTDECKKKKKSILRIVNPGDNNCLGRAILVAVSRKKSINNPSTETKASYDRVRDSRKKAQGIEAEALRKIVGSTTNSVKDIPLYEEYLKISICCYSDERNIKHPIYRGCPRFKDTVALLHSVEKGVGHFDVCCNPKGMIGTSEHCESCGAFFNDKLKHCCFLWCNICGRKDCTEKFAFRCRDCNRKCRSYDCYKAHKIEKKLNRGKNSNSTIPSMCSQNWQCEECGIQLKTNDRSPEIHECGEIKCTVCLQYNFDEHRCYMRSSRKKLDNPKFIFYDFECRQDDGTHVPNFCVAQSMCGNCEDQVVTSESKCEFCGSRCYVCNKKKGDDFERNACVTCGYRQVIFRGEDTKDKFCDWLFSKNHTDFTAIAHNAKGYDNYFLYSYLVNKNILPDNLIFQGTKLMYMHVASPRNIRLLDSLNFLPMPLSNLPKAFGLSELKKGFFPHFFNTLANQNEKRNVLPEKSLYGYEAFSVNKKREFEKWYSENYSNGFDFQKEMEEYCISDVNILLNACKSFRNLLIQTTGDKTDFDELVENFVDPFAYLTIASVCLGVFKSKFLVENWRVLTKGNENPFCVHNTLCKCVWIKARKMNADASLEIFLDEIWVSANTVEIVESEFVNSPIGLIPPHGYAGRDNHSKEAIEWLKVVEREYTSNGKKITIQTARCQLGEKRIICQGKHQNISYKVDGYFEYDGEKYICEYYGCNFHGCLQCYVRERELTKTNGRTLGQAYRDTILKERRLKSAGYKLITKWSCEFKNDLTSTELNSFVKSLNIQEPLNIRDSYFGGRTNAIVLHKLFTEGEKGYYVDFTSLYPDVLKYQSYPKFHPEKIIDNFEKPFKKECRKGDCIYANEQNHCNGSHWCFPYFGIAKVLIQPPKDLLFPVLPVKINGKLKFPLCYKCAEKGDPRSICLCSDDKRSFVQTYCTPEIEAALNTGYEIKKVFEVLHWSDVETYNPLTKEGGLFTTYINTFLKLKQESSGFPENVLSEEEIDSYIERYKEHEGISLEKSNIVKNPGLRSLSKLALNSFYRKFGQCTNLRKTVLVDDLGVLFNFFADPSKEIADFHLMSDKIIAVEFNNSKDFESQSLDTNVTIASFCTAYARLKLWTVLNKLQERVLYHDTDSIIFSAKDLDYIPELGEYLGELTNELSCSEMGCKGCSGHYIEEFVSCGPKNYSYKVNTGQTVCKVRGFSLNYENSKIINFESMKNCLNDWLQGKKSKVQTVKTEIRRDKYDTVIKTSRIVKNYGMCYDKRRIVNNYETVPFGYVSK